jgi:hypothetical protein
MTANRAARRARAWLAAFKLCGCAAVSRHRLDVRRRVRTQIATLFRGLASPSKPTLRLCQKGQTP